MALRLTLVFVFVSLSFQAFAIEGVYEVIIKKQKAKQASRWSLVDWLSTKKKIALMDQWLALNTDKNLFEFVLGYQMPKYDEDVGDGSAVQERDGTTALAELYISILGFHYEKSDHDTFDETAYDVRLRILGAAIQGTHLSLFYGKRELKQNDFGTFEQAYYGAELSLYLLSFIGLEGEYRKFAKEEDNDKVYSTEGERISYGGFLEMSFVRFYGHIFKEQKPMRSATSYQMVENDGLALGAKLMF